MAQSVVTNRNVANREKRVKGKKAILAVLARAAADSEFAARLAVNPQGILCEYFTLTNEDLAALASGDIVKIAGWIGKLDKKQATWLLGQLSKEN